MKHKYNTGFIFLGAFFTAAAVFFTAHSLHAEESAEPVADEMEVFAGFEDADTPRTEVQETVTEPVAAKTPKDAKKSPGAGKNPGTLVIPGFSRKKDGAALPAVESEIPRVALEEMIPDHALLIVRTTALEVLNQRGRYLFAQLGLGNVGPLEWIQLSAYGRAAAHVDMKGQAAVVYVPYGNLMARVIILPVRDYKKFVFALGENPEKFPEPMRAGYVSVVQLPEKHQVFEKNGYAFVVEPVSKETMLQLWQAKSYAQTHPATPCAMKNSHLSLELTSAGIQHLLDLGKIALEDFSPVFSEAMKSLKIPDPELDMAEGYYDRAHVAIRWMEQNLAGVRVDMCVKKDTTLTSVTLQPKPNSPLMVQVRDTTGPLVNTTLETGNFLKIVPDVPAPFAGQADITQSVAAKLEAPFDRVRHVEFSLALPGQGELLAEQWCFFLEVDDAQAFVTELILPKAELVGSYIGASALGDLGAKIAENLANGRSARQSRRAANNRPVRLPLADPQAAAQRGGEIGSRIGEKIGRNAGANEGMKVYDFDGYSLYISDLELYAREMKKMRAEQAGDFSHRGFDGDFRLTTLLQRGVIGLQTGDLQNGFQDVLAQFMNREATGGPDPLLAKRNLVLLLDGNHILIVPGNENVLRAAKNNWERVRAQYIPESEAPLPPGNTPQPAPRPSAVPTGIPHSENGTPGKFVPVAFQKPGSVTGVHPDWRDEWNAICEEVASPEKNIVRTALRLDGVRIQFLCDIIRANYAPELPHPLPSPLASDTPSTLAVTTVSGQNGHFFSATPHALSKNLLQVYLKMMMDKSLRQDDAE